MKKPLQPSLPPLEKRLWNFFLNIVKYPFRIAKKYETYNQGISELISVKNEPKIHDSETDSYFRDFQRKYTRLVFSCIYLPMLIGVAYSGFKIYQNKQNYVTYYNNLTAPIKEERFTRKIGASWDKLVYFIAKQPLSVDEATPFLISFLFSLAGAKFLSMSPVFQIEEEIKRKLVAMGHTDIEGNPWRIVWTPEAVLVVSFGKDPYQLAQEQKFWATINFPPGNPKQSKKDMSKFVVQRKHELSSNMVFKLEAKNEYKK